MKPKRLAFIATITLSLASAHAADKWWDGGTVDIPASGNGSGTGGIGTWNSTTAATPILNWDQGTGLAHVAWSSSANDTAIFGGGGATVTLGSPVTANRLVFNTPGYVFTGTAANILTLAGTSPTIVTNAGAAIGATGVAASTVLAGTEGLTITGVGGTGFSLASTSAHTLSGGLILKNGVSFSASPRNYPGTTATNLLNPNNALTFDGGHFSLSGFAGKTLEQTLGNATFNTLGSGTRLLVTTSGSTAGTTTILHLGTISGTNLGSAGAGGLITGLGSAPVFGTTHAITTTTAPTATNGTYGTRVIYTGDGGGTTGDWTTGTPLGNGIYQLTPYADTSYATMDENSVSSTTADAILPSNLTLADNLTNGTLKLGSGTTLDMGFYVLTLEKGGLISAGNAASLITGAPGGTCLTAGAASGYELIIHPYNSAGTTISAVIGDNPATSDPVAVTINNLGSNPLTLSGLNTYSGATMVNGTSALAESKSSVIVAFNKNKDMDSPLGYGSSVTLNGAVIQTNITGSSDRDIATTGNSGFYAKGNFIQTLAGNISGNGTFGIDGDFQSASNIVLTGASTFSGDIVFRPDGRLTLANTNALQNATLDMNGVRVICAFSPGVSSYLIGGLKGINPIDLGAAAVSIGNNNQSNDYWAALSGTTGSLTKVGAGIQTIRSANTYAGNTTVNNGVLKLDTIPAQNDVPCTILSAKTLQGFTLSQLAQLVVGQSVTGTGIAPGSTIASIDTVSNRVVLVSSSNPSGATAVNFAATSGGMPNSPVIEVQSGATLDASALPNAFAVGDTQILGGAGTVTGPISVSGKLSPGVGAVDLATTTGTLTTGNVTFTATGEYPCTINGTNCDLLAAGTLTVDPSAKIKVSDTPPAASYLIATYTGAEPTHFDASELPSGCTLDYTEAGKIKLVSSGVSFTPFEGWAAGASFNLNGPNALPGADPDGDGVKNIAEFALGGNPIDTSSNGASLARLQNVSGSPALTLTFLTRSGTTFDTGSGPRTATKDGVTYSVQGGQNLSNWTATITEVPAITAGMDPAPTGYEYHTFKTAGPVASTAKDFIRVQVVGQ